MREDHDPLLDLPEPPHGSDLAVPPTRVGSAQLRASATVALLGIAAVVITAILLAQLPAGPAPSTPPVARATPDPADDPAATPPGTAAAEDPAATSSPPPGPSLVPVARSLPRRLSRDDLRDRVLSGVIDEQLVFVDGSLRVTPVRCQSLAQSRSRCVDLAIPGIGLPVWAGAPALPWRGEPPAGAWLVTVARSGGLVYLGSLLPERSVPGSIGVLTRRLLAAQLAEPPRTLFQVDGWLVAQPPTACGAAGITASACPARAPFLAADEPRPDGSLRSERGGAVALASPPVDVDTGRPVIEGTFLVTLPAACDPADPAASCDVTPRWVVVARYEPGRSFRVLVP